MIKNGAMVQKAINKKQLEKYQRKAKINQKIIQNQNSENTNQLQSDWGNDQQERFKTGARTVFGVVNQFQIQQKTSTDSIKKSKLETRFSRNYTIIHEESKFTRISDLHVVTEQHVRGRRLRWAGWLSRQRNRNQPRQSRRSESLESPKRAYQAHSDYKQFDTGTGNGGWGKKDNADLGIRRENKQQHPASASRVQYELRETVSQVYDGFGKRAKDSLLNNYQFQFVVRLEHDLRSISQRGSDNFWQGQE